MPPNNPPSESPLHVQAIDKLRADLEWHGPSGKVMGHVVLPRALAQALLKAIDDDVIRR